MAKFAIAWFTFISVFVILYYVLGLCGLRYERFDKFNNNNKMTSKKYLLVYITYHLIL